MHQSLIVWLPYLVFPAGGAVDVLGRQSRVVLGRVPAVDLDHKVWLYTSQDIHHEHNT